MDKKIYIKNKKLNNMEKRGVSRNISINFKRCKSENFKLKEENKKLKDTLNILTNIKVLKKINKSLEDLRLGRYTVR